MVLVRGVVMAMIMSMIVAVMVLMPVMMVAMIVPVSVFGTDFHDFYCSVRLAAAANSAHKLVNWWISELVN